MDSRRAESFSDGVFAVAITVLVFNLLSIHEPASYRMLLHSWPQYASYVVSFLTIGIMWLNHHTMLSHVSRVDRITLVLNTFLLMGVVAVPFPTALVADGLASTAPAGAAQVAAVVYGLVLIAISIAFSAMWLYLSAHQESLAAMPIRAPRQATLRFSAGLIGYVVATIVAALGLPGVALGIYGLIAVYYLFEHLPEVAGDSAADEDAPPAGQAAT
jgi:uncharacterized membrane protein